VTAKRRTAERAPRAWRPWAAGGVALLALLLAGPPARADFAAGKAAFERHDYATAYKVLLPEAQAGNGEAEYMIGEMAVAGLGTPRSYQVAANWYILAASAGYKPAYVTLGLLFLHGAGSEDDPTSIPADPARAAGYLQVAADGGDRTAQYLIGQMYLEGNGVARDDAQAYRYTVEAAKRGVAGAQFNAGRMAARGEGTKTDMIEAYKWYALAARQSYPAAAQNRDLVATSLTPEELKRAEALVEKFQPVS
jgi:TPR repeat protein